MAELKLRKNEKGMILAIDMGNTNIVIGCVDDKKVLFEEFKDIIGIRHSF